MMTFTFRAATALATLSIANGALAYDEPRFDADFLVQTVTAAPSGIDGPSIPVWTIISTVSPATYAQLLAETVALGVDVTDVLIGAEDWIQPAHESLAGPRLTALGAAKYAEIFARYNAAYMECASRAWTDNPACPSEGDWNDSWNDDWADEWTDDMGADWNS